MLGFERINITKKRGKKPAAGEEWDDKEVKTFFKACKADGGFPRFRLNRESGMLRVYCYGGNNMEKGADTKRFGKIPEPVFKILTDSDTRNWKQIAELLKIKG